MDKIWRPHWPAGVTDSSIELPTTPLHVRLSQNARRLGSEPAIIFYGRVITFAELDEASDRYAGWLAGHGVRPGDRVAIFLQNCPQFAIAYYGGLKAGAVNVCLNPMQKSVELEYELRDAGVRALVTSDQEYGVVAPVRKALQIEVVALTAYRDFVPATPSMTVPPALLEPGAPVHDVVEDFRTIVSSAPRLYVLPTRRLDDTALIQYTSGTTGVPKGAELTHGNIVANCELQTRFVGLREDDVILAVLPWFHITGMESQLNMMAYCGVPLVALGRIDLDTLLGSIQRYRVTLTTLIATLNIAIVNYPKTPEYDLKSLRACFSGGAPVPAEIARRWEAVTGYQLIEGYGLSETTAPTHVNPPHRPKYGTVGVPLPLVEAKIVSLADGVTEMPIGQSGEIVVRGPMVMKGYWGKPEATAEVLRDGWFATGDIGRVDEEGYFTVEERKKDMLKVSGFSVFPAEVEALMYRHPAIAEVAVIGLPDAYRGENPAAAIVLKAAAKGAVTEEEIVDWCRAEMSAYKAPRIVRFVPSLPRNASGKVLKRLLRESMTAEATS
jgi:acyl-CoA synthetase (AMP-forming)/AMP-acid ligase II